MGGPVRKPRTPGELFNVTGVKKMLMRNESTEERTLSLDLPAALDSWLTERAEELGVEESELLVQLIGSYRVAADAEDGAVEGLADIIAEDGVDIETDVQETVDEAVAVAAPDEDAIARRVEDSIGTRLDGVEGEFDEKIEDVRRRVIQVKQEADAKAASDHDHDEFQRLDDLATRVEELEGMVERSDSEAADTTAELATRINDIRDKLTQVARVVVQLRDVADHETADDETLTEIQRTAAREGYEKAVCGACNETVRVGLLPDAECPHCRSPFGGLIGGSGGFFGSKPRLVGPDGRQDTERDDEGSDASSIVSERGTDRGEGGGAPMTTDGGADE